MKSPSVPRATAFGFGAGLAAALLWIAYTHWPRAFVLPYVTALMLTASCGLYILLATLFDTMRNPRRGVRIRPIRGFDTIVGLILAAPSLWGLSAFLPAL
jgi:hypothetical protein